MNWTRFRASKLQTSQGIVLTFTMYSSIVHTSAIVGAIIGTLGAMMIAVLGIFYIQNRVRRSPKPRTDALESPTETQPPPPVLPKQIPVKTTPEPYTLKYQEAQGIAETSLGPEQNSFIHPSVRIFTLDGRRINELIERMHILETRLATETPLLYRWHGIKSKDLLK
ncbi:hypothetical protein DFJ43DRAFT_892670 [Lentinula guzmanii]|uniref:Uncharacterized protein n=1 Tax=Lentinula guzmanii TaxID=2804957 RepID=A0AA38J7A1_9AGAR|nr:hypothetical protein DFJ43DRAFT_892670 [Lentinula guzmanii]